MPPEGGTPNKQEVSMPGTIIDIKIPTLGESVSEGTIAKVNKADGQYAAMDEIILELETDKATVEIRAEKAGTVKQLFKKGDAVKVGDVVAKVDTAGKPAGAGAPAAAKAEK